MTPAATDGFGRYGLWIRTKDVTGELALALEGLGIGAIWLGMSPPDLTMARELLSATESIKVATGITNIWNTEPDRIAAQFHELERDFPGRFVLGVGAGHREATQDYAQPYQAVQRYLDGLDAAGVGPEHRVLAALGPRMLRLARDRALGAHPYLTTPEHTRQAREILGPDRFLAPEQKIVASTDVDEARRLGGRAVDRPYLHLSNYLQNLRRAGFTDADFADGGSARLIDALVAHGTPARIGARLEEHLAAGASHVAIQVIGGDVAGAIRSLDLPR